MKCLYIYTHISTHPFFRFKRTLDFILIDNCSGSKSDVVGIFTMNLLIEGGLAKIRYHMKSMRRLRLEREFLVECPWVS